MGSERTSLLLAAVTGFLGVVLGAFGAHGVKGRLAGKVDAELRLSWWQTGAQYHLVHALAIGLCAVRVDAGHRGSMLAPWLFVLGIVLFSGSLYTMTLTGVRKLGAVTPLGGLSFLLGWAALAYGALRVVD